MLRVRRAFAALRGAFVAVRHLLVGLHNALFAFVLNFFESVNRKIRSRLPFWRMEEETFEHVQMAVQVFEFIILPFSLVYLFGNLFFLRENAFDSMLWGMVVFFYSSFLPDIAGVCRRKKSVNASVGDLPWHKKYSVLLFAPLFVLLLFSNMRVSWRTAETFHNFRSLTVYGGFLFLFGFVVFGGFPVSFGQVTEILILPFYGALGYLAHLKVDRVKLTK
jgi:hypothetical protein